MRVRAAFGSLHATGLFFRVREPAPPREQPGADKRPHHHSQFSDARAIVTPLAVPRPRTSVATAVPASNAKLEGMNLKTTVKEPIRGFKNERSQEWWLLAIDRTERHMDLEHAKGMEGELAGDDYRNDAASPRAKV